MTAFPSVQKPWQTKNQTPYTASRKSRRTRAEDIRLQLADEIVQSKLKPGMQLDEVGLATRFGVSRTPIREALRQLEICGLVELRPHCGCFVASPSQSELQELFVATAELEAVCAGLSAVHMTIAERRNLEDLLNASAVPMRAGDMQQYNDLNDAFHSAIYMGSHNDYLVELTMQTRLRLAPFRRAQFRTLGRLAQSQAEHGEIVASILRGDRVAAEAAMRKHIGIVQTAFATYVEQL